MTNGERCQHCEEKVCHDDCSRRGGSVRCSLWLDQWVELQRARSTISNFQLVLTLVCIGWLGPIIIERLDIGHWKVVDVMFIAFIVGGAGMLLLRAIVGLWVRKRP